MVEEVKIRRKYLNSGDVFILDLGLTLYQVGTYSYRNPYGILCSYRSDDFTQQAFE